MQIGKSYRLQFLLVTLPLICVLGLRLTGFDGMVGQDSYAYVDQARLMRSDLSNGLHNDSFHWPMGYPFLGVLVSYVGLTVPFAMQLLTSLCMAGLLLVMHELLRKIYPKESAVGLAVYLVFFLFLAPFLFRSTLLAMSDIPTVFILLCSIYFALQFYNSGKNWFLIIGVLSFSIACWMRYATLVFTVPVGLFYFAGIVRKNNWSMWWLGLSPLIFTVVYLILFREADYLYSHNALRNWDIANFFRRTHITQQGHYTYALPNVIYIWYPFFHYGFSFFSLIFLTINYRRLSSLYFGLIVFTYLCYVTFVAGLDAQNTRYLLPVYPLVLVLAYPGYKTIICWCRLKGIITPAMVTIFIVQATFTVLSFRAIFYRNVLEREITSFLNNYRISDVDQTAYLYSFDIDVALQSRGIPYQTINLWDRPIENFQKGSLVLFNEHKFAVQWKDRNPILNWNHLQESNSLEEIVEFNDHWILYKIE